MQQLLNIFVNICLLRVGPQQLPASSSLLAASAVAGLVTGTVVIVETFGGLDNALLAQLLDILLMLGLLRVGLWYTGRDARFVQTGTALLGSGALINLVLMPLQIVVGKGPNETLAGELGMLIYLVLIIWALVIVGHIVRHAFELPFWGGILIALNYFLLVNWLIESLFTIG